MELLLANNIMKYCEIAKSNIRLYFSDLTYHGLYCTNEYVW